MSDKEDYDEEKVMRECDEIRINKYLAMSGVCSRREADRLVQAKEVYVDGKLAENGTKVVIGMPVTVSGRPVINNQRKIYLAFHKPRGIVCTSETREKNNLIDYLHYPERITYCGRLDKESEGLLILTNDGELINDTMRAANYHEKEYIVLLDKAVTRQFLQKMSTGVRLEELSVTTRPCKVEQTGECEFRIILTQGLNRQIRRMCECLGYKVERLKRVRVMNVRLGNLKCGKYRELTAQELSEMKAAVENSKSTEMAGEINDKRSI